MFYVPLYVEALRSRPRLVFWLAVLAQATLWVAVPALLYSAPPGDLAHLLAVAHDRPLRPDVGPPLAYWLAIHLDMRPRGVFWAIVIAEGSIAAAGIVLFKRGKWKMQKI